MAARSADASGRTAAGEPVTAPVSLGNTGVWLHAERFAAVGQQRSVSVRNVTHTAAEPCGCCWWLSLPAARLPGRVRDGHSRFGAAGVVPVKLLWSLQAQQLPCWATVLPFSRASERQMRGGFAYNVEHYNHMAI